MNKNMVTLKMACLMVLSALWSAKSFALAYDGDVAQGSDSAASDAKRTIHLGSANVQYIQALISQWNSQSGRHFEVLNHEETRTMDLSCFDCSSDDLDSAAKILTAWNGNVN